MLLYVKYSDNPSEEIKTPIQKAQPWFPAKLKKIRGKTLLVLGRIPPETWVSTDELLYTSSHLFLIPFFVYFFTEQLQDTSPSSFRPSSPDLRILDCVPARSDQGHRRYTASSAAAARTLFHHVVIIRQLFAQFILGRLTPGSHCLF
jgi:hypothetical protein